MYKLILMTLLMAPLFASALPQERQLEACSYEISTAFLRSFIAAGGAQQTKPEMRLVLKSIVATCIESRQLHVGLKPSQVSGAMTAGYLRAIKDFSPSAPLKN